jgi:hypothetical protein
LRSDHALAAEAAAADSIPEIAHEITPFHE